MKLLKKDEMLKKDQVCMPQLSRVIYLELLSLASPCSSRTRRSCRIRLALGGSALLLLSRHISSVLDNGVSSGRGLDDDAYKVRHLL